MPARLRSLPAWPPLDGAGSVAADLSCRRGTADGDHACTDAAASERAHLKAAPDRTSAKTILSSNPSLMLARMGRAGGSPDDVSINNTNL